MEKLSYKVIFNTLDPVGFRETEKIVLGASPQADAESGVDETVGLVNAYMTDVMNAVHTRDIISIKRVCVDAFKIVYEFTFKGDYRNNTCEGITKLDYFCGFYKNIIYNSYKRKLFKLNNFVASVNYDDTYVTQGLFSYAGVYKTEHEAEYVHKEYSKRYMNGDTFGENIEVAIVIANVESGDINGSALIIHSNSPIPMIMYRELTFGVLKKPPIGIEYKYNAQDPEGFMLALNMVSGG